MARPEARAVANAPIDDGADARGFESLLCRYEERCRVRGYSERTIISIRGAVSNLGRWCLDRGIPRPADVTRNAMERYQRWLFHYRRPNGRPLALHTQHQRLGLLRGFFKYLSRERYVLYNPAAELELPRLPHRLPQVGLSVAEVEQLLAHPDVSTPLGLRDHAMIEVLYATGIRRAELASLDVFDLDLDRRRLAVRHGKGGRDRVVPLGERASAWMRRYSEDARPRLLVDADERAAFLTRLGTRFEPWGLGHAVRRIIVGAGLGDKTGACHLLRHTMATLMLEGGADIRYIQAMLGHASMETTEVYTRVAIEQLAAVHSASHPGVRLGHGPEVAAELAAETADLAGEACTDEGSARAVD